jgi:hypothetical protein
MNTNIAEVRRLWSHRDVFEAHLALDAFDDLRPPVPNGR